VKIKRILTESHNEDINIHNPYTIKQKAIKKFNYVLR